MDYWRNPKIGHWMNGAIKLKHYRIYKQSVEKWKKQQEYYISSEKEHMQTFFNNNRFVSVRRHIT